VKDEARRLRRRTGWRIAKVLGLFLVLGVGGCTTWCGWALRTSARELDAHIRIIDAVNTQMGFSYGTPYEQGEEVFVIESVQRDGVMERAGLKTHDYPQCSIASLYERIVFGQGRVVEIPVVRNQQPVVINVAVPKLTLPDDPRQLHWYWRKHRE
jgi:hypothetical protein